MDNIEIIVQEIVTDIAIEVAPVVVDIDVTVDYQQKGDDGLSAYQIAVNEGFSGTIEEWLGSLKGEKGDPFVYSDFTPEQLADLKGEKGDPLTYADLTPEQILALQQPAIDAANLLPLVVTVETYDLMLVAATGDKAKKIFVTQESAYNEANEFFTYDPEHVIAYLGIDFNYTE